MCVSSYDKHVQCNIKVNYCNIHEERFRDLNGYKTT